MGVIKTNIDSLLKVSSFKLPSNALEMQPLGMFTLTQNNSLQGNPGPDHGSLSTVSFQFLLSNLKIIQFDDNLFCLNSIFSIDFVYQPQLPLPPLLPCVPSFCLHPARDRPPTGLNKPWCIKLRSSPCIKAGQVNPA